MSLQFVPWWKIFCVRSNTNITVMATFSEQIANVSAIDRIQEVIKSDKRRVAQGVAVRFR